MCIDMIYLRIMLHSRVRGGDGKNARLHSFGRPKLKETRLAASHSTLHPTLIVQQTCSRSLMNGGGQRRQVEGRVAVNEGDYESRAMFWYEG